MAGERSLGRGFKCVVGAAQVIAAGRDILASRVSHEFDCEELLGSTSTEKRKAAGLGRRKN